MRYVYLLALLVFVDCVLSAFRSAAGRVGLLDKHAYYRRVVIRGAYWAVAVLVANAIVSTILCAVSRDPKATWELFIAAARPLVIVYGIFATLIFAAFGFYFSPFGDFRVLTNVIIFGPLTLARPWVIAAGLAYAAISSRDVHVTIMALVAGSAMLTFERIIGRVYEPTWRALVKKGNGPA